MSKILSTVSFLKVLRNAKRILKNPLPFHKENFDKYGDTFKLYLGFNESVLITRDAGFAKHMLQKQHRKYYKSELQTKDLAKYVGEGLLTSNAEKWLKQRRLIQPAFHKKKLETIITTIKSVVAEEISRIRPNETIDVFPLMNDLAFKVVAKSLFSYTDTGTNISRLQFITETAQKTLVEEIRQPYKKWWFNLGGKTKNTLKLTQEGRDILNTIIEERKESGKAYNDLLDMLLESKYDDGSTMDNEQLIDEIFILFVAGHETTSNSLTFTLLLLAFHPEIQEKMYNETQNNVSHLPLMEQMSMYPYIKQCIEETMRLYPPAYFSDRVAIESDQYNGLEVSKGTTILISFYEIHRHASFWKDPETFDPDRFGPEMNKKECADWYFPFGVGPRMCIGNNFAMYEMILAMNEIVSKYKIETNLKGIKIQPLITLKPQDAFLKFITR